MSQNQKREAVNPDKSGGNRRNALGYQAGIVSIIVNLLLFVLKYWAGIVSGSVALIADAWHTLSDSLSSIAVIVGVKLSSRKPDRDHPFGHGRWEYLASIFIGLILAIVAYEFLVESIGKFMAKEEAMFGTFAIIATAVSILAKEALAQYSFYIARKTDNASVKADGWHHRTDALSSVIVLAGILLKDYFWWIDSVLGMIIALMLFYVVYEIMKDAVNKLLGIKPSEKLMGEIKQIVDKTTGPKVFAHHFHLHDYGIHKELTFHIKLNPQTDIQTGHRIATQIEQEIHEKLGLETTIHVEPL